MKFIKHLSLLTLSLIGSSQAATILQTGFTGRTFVNNIVTVNDYTVDGIANPGALTFNGIGTAANSFFTSPDATDKVIPTDNAPIWNVLIPINVLGADIDLGNISITFEAFNNGGDSKTGISGGFSPNYQPTVSLLDSGQNLIDSQTLDAWTENGNNRVAGWTGVFDFGNDDLLIANTNYFIQINMTGSGGNNVGLNSLTISTNVPEPSTTALLGLGGLSLIMRRRK